MSREVRRVPLDWQHPTEPNPYWREQVASRLHRGDPESRLHAPDVRFHGLVDGYDESLADWQSELDSIQGRSGQEWEWNVEYHLTGHKGQDDAEPVAHPFYVEGDALVDVRDEDHLYELALASKLQEKPDAADYMPRFDGPEDALGWCLYETVSEGTPVTPVFATADELIDHLATVGQDWGQRPMRRTAAEQLVRSGSSFGSMMVVGGTLYHGSDDADRIADVLAKRAES